MADGGKWLEHKSGPLAGGTQSCTRCFMVLWVATGSASAARPRWLPGQRVASDGEMSMDVTGWPYTPCEPWQPQVGDHPARAANA